MMETENVEIIKSMVSFGIGTAHPMAGGGRRRRSEDVLQRIAGHALWRRRCSIQNDRLPRTVSEVSAGFEQIRPRFEEAVRAPRNY